VSRSKNAGVFSVQRRTMGRKSISNNRKLQLGCTRWLS
jgi:hypothetical protein